MSTRERKYDDATILAIKAEKGRLRVVAEKYAHLGLSKGYISKLRNGQAKKDLHAAEARE